jgi:hypothetical protein
MHLLLSLNSRHSRCHRLDKDCVPSSTSRKKPTKKTTTSKRTQLEDKLDDLVSLLRTQHAAPQQEQSANYQTLTPCSVGESPRHPIAIEASKDCLSDLELLKIRDLHLPTFPFIYLPSDVSAEQLSLEKPLLSLAFKTISNKAASRQTELSKKLRTMVAMKVMVDGEKSIDLLLTILACMAWCVPIALSSVGSSRCSLY